MQIKYSWFLPTSDWTPDNNPPFQQDIYRSTKYFVDKRNLHWPHGRGIPTIEIFFIQSYDGQCNIVFHPSEIYLFLDANLPSDVVLARIPVELLSVFEHTVGPLMFIGNRHPDHMTRVDAMCYLVNKHINHRWIMRQPANEPIHITP